MNSSTAWPHIRRSATFDRRLDFCIRCQMQLASKYIARHHRFWEKSKEVRYLVIKPWLLTRCEIQPSWLMGGICIATVDIRFIKKNNYSLVRMNRRKSFNPDFLFDRKIIKPWLWGRGAQTTRNNSWRLCRYCDTSFEVVFLAHSWTACPLCEPLTLGKQKVTINEASFSLVTGLCCHNPGCRRLAGRRFHVFFPR